jgi:hypothetical protein
VRLHAPASLPAEVTPAIAEVEAESVAYLVTSELGLDSSAYTIPYVTGWSNGDADTVLGTAHRTVGIAREIAEEISTYLGRDLSTTSQTTPDPTVNVTPDSDVATDVEDARASRERPVRYADAAMPLTAGATTPPRELEAEDAGVRLSTPTGWWDLGWDPPTATYYASHQPADPAFGPSVWLGTRPRAIPTVGALEQELGFPLPSAVRAALDAGRRDHPPAEVRAFGFLPDAESGGGDEDGLTEVADELEPGVTRDQWPEPASVVLVPGGPATTYDDALRSSKALRTWQVGLDDGLPTTVQVEILDAAPFNDSNTSTARTAVTYRICEDGQVVFSGDDITAPGHVDPFGDDTVRAVVDLLCQPTERAELSSLQQRFLDDHGELLTGLVAVPDPPYPPGLRIAVTSTDTAVRIGGPAPRTLTGTVLETVTDQDGAAIGYVWRPDRATSPATRGDTTRVRLW